MRRPLVVLALLLLAALLIARARPRDGGEDGTEPGGPDAESPAAVAPAPPSAPADAVSESAGTVAAAPRDLVRQQSAGCGPCESCQSAALRAFMRRQNADGSWGGLPEEFEGREWNRTEATALALLAFLGAGYTPLSRDTVDGRDIGAALTAALDWFFQHPPADASAAALHALVASELAGITGSEKWTQLAEQALIRHTASYDGTGAWAGDPALARFSDMSLRSAALSGVPGADLVAARAGAPLRDRLAAGDDPAAAARLFWLAGDRSEAALAGLAAAAEPAPDPAAPAYLRTYLATLDVWQANGPGTEGWKTWSGSVKEALLPLQARDGTWPGDLGPTAAVVRDSLATLTLEVYYRYENALGAEREKHGE